MTKNDLVDAIKKDMPHLTKQVIKQEVENFFSILKTEISEGSTIKLDKLGSLSHKVHQPRTINNLNGDGKTFAPKRPGVTFKPFSAIKDALNPSAEATR